MTNKDKQLIAEYMDWEFIPESSRPIVSKSEMLKFHDFDLNDAGLCVQRMVEDGENELADFQILLADKMTLDTACDDARFAIVWFFNANNFFTAMAAWLKERKEK